MRRVTHYPTLVAFVVTTGGCSSNGPCDTLGEVPSTLTTATLELACATSTLSSVVASGPCAASCTAFYPYQPSDGVAAGLPWSGPCPNAIQLAGQVQSVTVQGTDAGSCNVELSFSSGFTYSAVVSFSSSTMPEPACGGEVTEPYFAPTPSMIMVDNPADTCLDGGADAAREGGLGADASVE
jgi:hypothetical protein